VYTIEIGPDGSKWIGTYGGGLMHFQNNKWKTYTPFGYGSTLVYGNQWTKYNPGQGLGDLWVYDVAFDRKGQMWVATWKGASRFNGDSFQTYSESEGLIDKWVYAMGVDLDNSLWFGTEGGVTHFDGTKWKSYTHADGLGAELKESIKDPKYSTNPLHHSDTSKLLGITNPNYVVSIVIDQKGTKWFGTWGTGLSRFDGKNWKTITTADGLPGNFVLALKTDKQGKIWAGTDQGVGVFNGKIWKQYTQKDGLLDNFVYSILLEDNGTKWFGTRRGLTQFVGE
jgi:ligand-binding sensor domain-containing protein